VLCGGEGWIGTLSWQSQDWMRCDARPCVVAFLTAACLPCNLQETPFPFPEGTLFYSTHVENHTPLATFLGPVAVALGLGATPVTNSSGGHTAAAAAGGGDAQAGLLGTFTCTFQYNQRTGALTALTLPPAGQA
jgi:hypothetical protein